MSRERYSKEKILKDGSRPKKLSSTAGLLQEVSELGGVDNLKNFYETVGAEKVADDLKQYVGEELDSLRKDLISSTNLPKVRSDNSNDTTYLN